MELADYDWEQEMNERLKKKNYYSENELFNILTQLVKTCSLLEKNNISHRDLKPKNILISNGKYKLSDFSDSKVIKEGKTKQLVRGTELFMSPLLLKAYHENYPAFHDSFKSDVFSMGMCILLAATLDDMFIEEYRNVKGGEKIMKFLMNKLSDRYSVKLADVLCIMSQSNEDKRPNFVRLEQIIEDVY